MSSASPEVTVVIPCYNAAAFLREAVDSVVNQAGVTVQVIVIDDGSTDDSRAILESYGTKIELLCTANGGAQAARNLGLGLAKARYVKFFDADDILAEGALAAQVKASEALGNRRAIVFGRADNVDRDGRFMSQYPVRGPVRGEDPVTHILLASPVTSCPLHRTDWVREVGGFDASIPRQHEHELHLRLAISGVEFVFQDVLVYRYRHYSSTVRLSNGGESRFGAFFTYNYVADVVERLRRSIATGPQAAHLTALAQLLWKSGRALAAEGLEVEAQAYFAYARELAPSEHAFGRLSYRTLVRFFGPLQVEQMLRRAR